MLLKIAIVFLSFGAFSPLAWSQSSSINPMPANISGEEGQPCVTGFLPGPSAPYEADQRPSAARDAHYDSEIPGPSFNDAVDPDMSGY